MDIINGDRDELVHKQKKALVRFVCSTDESESRSAMDEVTVIGKRLRPRGTLTLVPDKTDKTQG